jgi:hypothetical protein
MNDLFPLIKIPVITREICNPQNFSKARQRAENNAIAHNNYLTSNYLRYLSDHEVLCFCHPLDRKLLAKDLEIELTDENWDTVKF